MGIEESYIRKTEGLIRSIKHGTRKPSDAKVEHYLERVKKTNFGMYEELSKRYEKVISDYREKEYAKESKKMFA
jgi:hypothetical protein